MELPLRGRPWSRTALAGPPLRGRRRRSLSKVGHGANSPTRHQGEGWLRALVGEDVLVHRRVVARGNDDIKGTDWSDVEQDLIVADYFAILEIELAGGQVNKAARNRALQALTGRSPGSIERKHMNISAVLIGLGMDRIDGYAPAKNFQKSMVQAIGRYLDAKPVLSFEEPRPASGMSDGASLYLEQAPPLGSIQSSSDPRLAPIARKHDQAQRDARNRALGRAGEALVVEFERRRLYDAGAVELSRQVRWVADQDGDGAGYDILSFNPGGDKRLIEVKTTNGPQRTPFFLTRNEERVSREQDTFRLYRLYDFAKTPKLFKLRPPLGDSVVLETETWRAGFG